MGTDITNVGVSPAYKPAVPSLRNIDNNVANVPPVLGSGVDNDDATDEDDRSGVNSIGRTQSINPLFNTSVPHPRHGSTRTPRNEVGAICFAPDAC